MQITDVSNFSYDQLVPYLGKTVRVKDKYKDAGCGIMVFLARTRLRQPILGLRCNLSPTYVSTVRLPTSYCRDVQKIVCEKATAAWFILVKTD